ncbi:conserved hypothetical protein [Histoplasma capsulatum G186AR]|uniref:Uncharacterized protein n=1 Tax=Ajellomyces capsulatus (strain G186AR / H82 / ATCC MYA-2454 / RMSCC 2432) TaxID=447093 RepID=C0NUT7_AJECG|nr:uncharacterized protein HCBG_06701 [Histoplasma capsulatum G186AR]EEH04750.1 conserved hypothetical protein [Histoplasma capsulatum G186AR]
MVLATPSCIARFGALSSSAIVLGLGATFIQNRASSTELLIYIEVLSALTVVGSMVPPYPNFAYDLVWTLAWSLAAVFALVIQGGVRIVDAKFDIRSLKNRLGFGNSHIASHFVCSCIIGVVLLTVGLLVLFIWGVPAFGRYLMYRTPIPDYNVTLTNPTNDNISFKISTNIRVPDGLKISVDPMHADFFIQDRMSFTIPVVTVDLPKMSFRSNDRIELVNETLKLGNLNEFARLAEQVAYQPAFSEKAFGNFVQIDIRDVGLQLPDAEGYNVVARIVMANPTPIYLTLVGRVIVALNEIVPGNNTLLVKGNLDFGTIQKNIIAILKTELPYLKQGLLMASAVVESMVSQGQRLSYWENSFQSIKMSAITPMKPLFSSVIGNHFESSESAPMELPDTGGVGGDIIASLADKVLKTMNNVGEHLNLWNGRGELPNQFLLRTGPTWLNCWDNFVKNRSKLVAGLLSARAGSWRWDLGSARLFPGASRKHSVLPGAVAGGNLLNLRPRMLQATEVSNDLAWLRIVTKTVCLKATRRKQ